jgi:hypothetical protein
VTWPNPDVTPVGVARDATGRPVSRHRRGWVRVLLGGLLLVGGIVLAGQGILRSIEHRSDAFDEAVGEGRLEGVGPTDPVRFTVDETTGRDFTIYLDTPGTGNDTHLDREVQSTECAVVRSDGTDKEILGRIQGTASDIGGLRSVGGFSATPGETTVTCGWRSPNRRLDRGRADSRTFLVTPGTPSDAAGGVLSTIGGVFLALAGGALLAWGVHGRHELAT